MPPPENPLLGDPVMQISHRRFVAEAWRDGHLPLWNPEVMAGHPQAGDTLSQPFYPPHIVLGLFFWPLEAFGIQLLLQIWLAGLLMYTWMRTLKIGRKAAFSAALVWPLAGYHQAWSAYPFWLGTLAWLPAVAAAWEVARRNVNRAHSARAVALGGLAAGLAVMGGQLQFAVFGAIVLGVYGIGRTLGSTWPHIRRDLNLGVAIAAIGVLVSSVHWLPAIDLARDTVRPPFSFDALRATGVPFGQLITAVAPWALGDPRHGDYVGAQNANEMALYIGLIPLLLVLSTPFARRGRTTVIGAVLALGVISIATGTIIAAPLALVPFIQRFGLMRWLSMWPLAAALLIALGLDAPRDDPSAADRLRRAILAWTVIIMLLVTIAVVAGDPQPTIRPIDGLILAGSVAALILWTYRPRSTARLALVLLIVFVDLVGRWHDYTPSALIDMAFPRPLSIARMSEERRSDVFRIATFQRDRIVLGPSVAPNVGLDEIGGYTSSGRASYRDFIERLSDPPGIDALASNANMVTFSDANPLLLRMLNVRYVLADAPLPDVAREIVRQPLCERTHTLTQGESIGRDITLHAGGLNRIDVRVANDADVAVHLVPFAGSDEHLAYAVLDRVSSPVDGAPVNRAHVDNGSARLIRPMYFEPIADSDGRTFHVFIDQPKGATGPTPEVCLDELGPVVDAWTTEPRYPLAFESNGLFVHRAPEPYGRAWMVPTARFVDGQPDALLALGEATFDPGREVIVEVVKGASNLDDVPLEHEAPAEANEFRLEPLAVSVTDDGPNVRRITFDGPPSGWLVLSEAYAPGWKARVDGEVVAVHRANGGLQAIAVPSGARDVVLSYRPLSIWAGFGLTLIGLFTAVGIAVVSGRPHGDRNKRASRTDRSER